MSHSGSQVRAQHIRIVYAQQAFITDPVENDCSSVCSCPPMRKSEILSADDVDACFRRIAATFRYFNGLDSPPRHT
jgi:hypothetical protein